MLMKKLVLMLFLTFSMFSCGPILPRYFSGVDYVDYDKYNKKFFMVTESNSLNFNYQTISSFEMYEFGGYVKNEFPKDQFDTLVYKDINLQEVIDKLVDKGIQLKANGIMNLKITWVDRYSSDKILNPVKLSVSGVYFRRIY